MYGNKLAIAIKHNGKILREFKDVVYLPFGSEFSVLVKNLENRRVKFTLSIDGADALDGTHIVVPANSSTEIKRFIRNGNMDTGNSFKFIERTAAISDGPRGNRIDDGIVRIEYWFELPEIRYTKSLLTNYIPPYGEYYSTNSVSYRSIGDVCGAAGGSLSATAQSATNDVGITVPGSVVDQKFVPASYFNAEPTSSVLVLKLSGATENGEIAAPVTVKANQKCVTCGQVNKMTSKFCSGCGTCLTVL